jgi:hypothetical protein
LLKNPLGLRIGWQVKITTDDIDDIHQLKRISATAVNIRDYSNYLIPHGGLDVVTALGIIGRGLVANALLVLPIIFFCMD